MGEGTRLAQPPENEPNEPNDPSRCPKSPPTLEDVLECERAYLEKRREAAGLPPPNDDAVGLSLSGGGIRSATFNLGVLQALHRHGLLKYVDYLSTVSGGGFIGGAWSAAGSQPEEPPGEAPAGVTEEAPPAGGFPLEDLPGSSETPHIRHLREHSNYMTGRGLYDLMRGSGYLLRGILSNFVLLLPIFAVLIAAYAFAYIDELRLAAEVEVIIDAVESSLPETVPQETNLRPLMRRISQESDRLGLRMTELSLALQARGPYDGEQTLVKPGASLLTWQEMPRSDIQERLVRSFNRHLDERREPTPWGNDPVLATHAEADGGLLILTGSVDNTLNIWRHRRGRTVKKSAPLYSFSADISWLGDAGTINTGDHATWWSFSPDGLHILALEPNTNLQIWGPIQLPNDDGSGAPILPPLSWNMGPLGALVSSVQFPGGAAYDGADFIIAIEGQTATVWALPGDSTTGSLVPCIQDTSVHCMMPESKQRIIVPGSLAFATLSSKQDAIIAANNAGRVWLRQTPEEGDPAFTTNECEARIPTGAAVSAIAFTQDETALILGTNDGQVFIADNIDQLDFQRPCEELFQLTPIAWHDQPILQLYPVQGARTFVTVGQRGNLRFQLYDENGLGGLLESREHDWGLNTVSLLPGIGGHSDWIVGTDRTRRLRAWALPTLEPVWPYGTPDTVISPWRPDAVRLPRAGLVAGSLLVFLVLGYPLLRQSEGIIHPRLHALSTRTAGVVTKLGRARSLIAHQTRSGEHTVVWLLTAVTLYGLVLMAIWRQLNAMTEQLEFDALRWLPFVITGVVTVAAVAAVRSLRHLSRRPGHILWWLVLLTLALPGALVLDTMHHDLMIPGLEVVAWAIPEMITQGLDALTELSENLGLSLSSQKHLPYWEWVAAPLLHQVLRVGLQLLALTTLTLGYLLPSYYLAEKLTDSSASVRHVMVHHADASRLYLFWCAFALLIPFVIFKDFAVELLHRDHSELLAPLIAFVAVDVLTQIELTPRDLLARSILLAFGAVACLLVADFSLRMMERKSRPGRALYLPNGRQIFEWGVVGGLTLLASVTLLELQPYVLYHLHFLKLQQHLDLETFIGGASAAAALAMGPAVAIFRKAGRKVQLAMLGLLGPIIPTAFYLIGLEYLVFHWDKWLVTAGNGRVQGDPLLVLGVFLLAIAAAVILNKVLSVNSTGLHRFYRDRLGRAYLGRLDKAGRFESATGLKLSAICPDGSGAPYHLLNAALNLQASDDLEVHWRKSDFFQLSRDYVGCPRTGWCRTRDLETLFPELNLAAAMATSGAAAAPNMGTFTPGPAVFLMALLNIRMGLWMPHPRIVRQQALAGPEKLGQRARVLRWMPGGYRILQEMLGRVHEYSRHIYLTDGGHLENLGVYELLRRRCKTIIVGDAEADPKMTFNGLARLMRYARIDLGIDIELDSSPLAPDDDGNSSAHVLTGWIRYPEERDEDGALLRARSGGLLLYVKLSVTGDEDQVIQEYRATHPDFPHQTTTDQAFEEDQFEAYRSLGAHTIDELVSRVGAPGAGPKALDQWLWGLSAIQETAEE